MSAPKQPAPPTTAEIRAQIERAENALSAANSALGEALFAKAALPDRDISSTAG